MSLSQAERAELCDLLDRVGPHAPTLCEGWRTEDLVLHLVIRERRPDALPGMVVPFLSGYTRSVEQRIRSRHRYADLVDLVRQGPPKWSPHGLVPPLDTLVNAVEFFIHHEDVRRAAPDWKPRDLPPEVQDFLWQRLRSIARMLLRRSPVGVVLRRPSGERAAGRMGEPAVIVTGEPAELLLFVFGRGEQAQVTFDGPTEAVDRLRKVRFGL